MKHKVVLENKQTVWFSDGDVVAVVPAGKESHIQPCRENGLCELVVDGKSYPATRGGILSRLLGRRGGK